MRKVACNSEELPYLVELNLSHLLSGCSIWWPMEASTLYDFHASNEEELSFSAGVSIKVIITDSVIVFTFHCK